MSAGMFMLAGMQFAQAYNQSRAIDAQSKYQSSMLDISSRFAGLQAEDAIFRGKKEARNVKKRVRRILGSQRVAFAGQGVDLDSGSAAAVQQSTEYEAELDAIQIKNNAWKQAWGYRVKAFDLRNQSRMTRIAGRNQAQNTLLAGALQASSTAYMGMESSAKKAASMGAGGG